MKPHKHAELIKAWADGAIIQWVGAVKHGGEKVWMDIENPDWCSNEYRIKPEPKPDVVITTTLGYTKKEDGEFLIDGNYKMSILYKKPKNIKFTFDSETGELKSAEVLK